MAQAVLGVMEALTEVMNRETALLERQDMAGIGALRVEKTRLVRDYQQNVTTLAQRPDLLKQAAEPVRDRLRVAGESLAEATQRNAIELQAAMSATQSLIQTVVDAAREKTKMTECYGDPRKTPLMLGSYSPVCPPVAVDRTA